MSSVMPPGIATDPRRMAVYAEEGLNALDYVEVEDDRRTLRLTFLKPIVAGSLKPANVLVTGVERFERLFVIDVRVAERPHPNVLRVMLRFPGDRSTYRVRLIDEGDAGRPPAGYDVVLSQATFRFVTAHSAPHAALDCDAAAQQAVEEAPLPEIDYLAKDYGSFRRLILERLSLLVPDWQESSAADVGMMLVELLAYVGDYISYQQDAIATEAYLPTARLRTSLRRLARLVDYRIDDGANARAVVHVNVDPGAPSFELAKGTAFLTAAIGIGQRVAARSDVATLAAQAGCRVFESVGAVTLRGALAEPLEVYTWGARDYTLEAGSTAVTLHGHIEGLHAGNILLVHARPGDAPDLYHPVRLTSIAHTSDPIGGLFATKPRRAPAALTKLEWDRADALPQAMLVAEVVDDGEDATYRTGLTTVLANNVIVDDGLTLTDSLGAAVDTPFRPLLPNGPLVFAQPFLAGPAAEIIQPAGVAAPSIALTSASDAGPISWTVRPDLLESDSAANDFVVEVEDDGSATLRFGDGEFGCRPETGTTFTATYRVGGGAAGNVGEGTIASIVSDDVRILSVRNPLAAVGGLDPEALDHVRQNAPGAYREQQRAVTASDYVALANAHSDVLDAGADVRDRRGVRSVIVTVDRKGGAPFDGQFGAAIRSYLEPFALIGVDIEVRGARLVPLQVIVAIVLRAGYRKIDVRLATERALRLAFAPDNFTLGAPVYASAIVAVAMAVAGVASAAVEMLAPLDRAAPDVPADGVLTMGPFEKAQVSDDPRYPDRGSIRVRVRGAT